MTWPVLPLAIEAIETAPAVQLFVGRAAAARPGFLLDAVTLPIITRICRQLDGLRLAIEIAASKVRRMSLEQISARLMDRFGLLVGGSRTASQRQQTLRGMLNWSHSLLQPDEQRVFRMLGVFRGGFDIAAVDTVSGNG